MYDKKKPHRLTICAVICYFVTESLPTPLHFSLHLPIAENSEIQLLPARAPRSLRVLDCAAFADKIYLDLTRVFHFGFDLVTLRGSGMSPTMNGGDMVICVKQSMLNRLAGIIPEEYRKIKQNDLVLVRYTPPSATGEDKKSRSMLVIKRVIGTGGDEFDSGGGQLILNQESLVGDTGNSDLIYPIRVPAGRLFLMGDDNAVSIDSRRRAFGMPAESDVQARPLAVVWPLFAIGPVN